MTLLELVTQMRHWLNDFGGYAHDDATWESDDADALWKNTELTGYLVEAEKEFCRVNPILDSTTAAITQLSLVAATSVYALHSRILFIDGVRLAGGTQPLVKLEADDMDELTLDWEAETGTVEGYLADLDNGQIRFYKTPTATATANLRVGRLPVTDLSWASNDESPEIPLHGHLPIAYYAMHLAYLKDDDETLNEKKSGTWFDKWNLHGGHPVSAHSLRVRREAHNRPQRSRTYY